MAKPRRSRKTAPKTRKKPQQARPAPPAPQPAFPTAGATVPIVGIGASAGGLDAFKKFFAAMPGDAGMAFVLIPHLDPTHESLMVGLLAKQTPMPVTEARDGMAVAPNRVYIIPPNKYLAIRGGILRLSPPSEPRGWQTAIDFFLQSLAEDQKERAIGIVLSGTGSHGTRGLREIKAAGGMVMCQAPDTAEYDQMPRSAVATGLVDYVLPPEAMPEALIKYAQHSYVNREAETLPPEDGEWEHLNRILALLRARTRHDFRAYRKSMLMRRVQRRMGLCHIDRFTEYLEHLRNHVDEVRALSKDLLIGVTGFFREPEAFHVFQHQVLPELVGRSGKAGDDEHPIRVWVPGCATGEEAYSIAILLHEQLAATRHEAAVQIFATDIDEAALDVARAGLYPDSITSDVSAERLKRFFAASGEHHYQVSQPVRESIVFAPQNLISDAPFSKLDVVSCRNVLIYLEPAVQARIIALFHFALRDGGYLMLGPSESVGPAVDLFEPVSKKWRVYRRVGGARRELVEIPIVATGEPRRPPPPAEPAARPPKGVVELMHKVLLDDFAPASLLINRRYEIVCMQGDLVDYLHFPPGEPTRDLLSMARPGLRTKIRSACHAATGEQRTIVDADARVKRNGRYVACSLTVRLLADIKDAEGLLLVTFQDRPAEPGADVPGPEAGAPPAADDSLLVQQLEHELKTTRGELQTTIEELESSNEELKASNEEVMSMNEELQSANEELETSKEELQSLNEELTTVNSQLQDKVDELDKANNDMMNLLASTDIATLFLDPELRIKRFTPPTRKLLNLVTTDIGRPLGDFAPKFSDTSLLDDCRRVIENLTTVETEVSTQDNRTYLRRILPYRTADNRIEGVVITFVDLTEQRRATAAADAARLYAQMAEHLPAGAAYVQNGRLTMNRTAEEITGYGRDELTTVNAWFSTLFRERADEVRRLYEDQRERGFLDRSAAQLVHRKDGQERYVEFSAYRFEDAEVWLMDDVTDRRRADQALRATEDYLSAHLARELHDEVAGQVTGIGLLAQALQTQLAKEESPLADRARELAQEVVEIHAKLRAVAAGLMPVDKLPEGLMAALDRLAEDSARTHAVACRFICESPVFIEDARTGTHLFRIAQEAVGNAMRHSGATEVLISLEGDGDVVQLVVSDDGRGFGPLPKGHAGLGLHTMRQRARLLRGELTIASRTPRGTAVTCRVPFATR